MNFSHFLYSKMVGSAQACYKSINTKAHPVLPKSSCLVSSHATDSQPFNISLCLCHALCNYFVLHYRTFYKAIQI